jgi:DNA-binding beta-propeller fold protein YncE
MVPPGNRKTEGTVIMSLKTIATIAIPGSAGSSFDHGAFDPATRRVFVAHTGRSCVEVIDHDAGKHVATLPDFPEAAGVVAFDGMVLVTNRGAASMAWVDARSLKTQRLFNVGTTPNGVAIVARQKLAIAACIGDDSHRPTLHAVGLDGGAHHTIELPGRPRWCVTDASATRVFLAIQEPSMVLSARLPDLQDIKHLKVPAGGAHGLEIDHRGGRLYVACDDAVLVEVDAGTGNVSSQWPIAGAPDVTFFNPTTGLVHVAIGKPGLVQSIDPRTGGSSQTMTAAGAHTTALVPPNRLYVFSPSDGGAIVLADG